MTPFAIVTVIHDSAPELGALLASIERHLRPVPRILVVDSGSSDSGAALARSRGAEVIELPTNLGFGAGSNAGLERVREPVTALVNPDVELLDDGLATLAADAASRERLMAPRLLNLDGSPQDSAHPRPGTAEALIPALAPRPLLPARLRRRYEPWRSSSRREVGWVVGACLVARSDLLRGLGPFDPSAFMFYEDMELCLRARREGVPTVLRPDVAVRHHGGASVDRALAGRDLELLSRRRVEARTVLVCAAQALHDLVQRATFAITAAGRALIRRGGALERDRLRALMAARRRP